jgi:ATP/maltotriose-dependent transcriptional regulator MalT
MYRGDAVTAQAHYAEAIRLLRAEEDMTHAISARSASAVGHVFLGNLDDAVSAAQDALAVCARRGDLWCRSYACYALALTRWARGEHGQAKQALHEGLRIAAQFGHIQGAAMQIELLAWVLQANGEHERAAETLGVADCVWPYVGAKALLNSDLWIRPHDECVRALRLALGEHRFTAAFHRGGGAAHDFDQAVKLVLSESPEVTPSPPLSQALLSRREQQVAELVAEGLTNKEIASRLVISQRTAETHVVHVLTKLGFTSRTQIATWVVEQRRSGYRTSEPVVRPKSIRTT